MTAGRRHLLAAGLGAAAALRAVRARADNPEKLTLVVTTAPPDPPCHCFFYARERGFYRDRVLDVTITAVTNSGNGIRAVLAGSADLTWVDPGTALQAIDGGGPLRVVSSFMPHLDYTLLGRKGVAGTRQLPGLRFAVASIGGPSQVIPRRMIQLAGGDPSRVQWVALGNSAARIQALLAGTVDATILTSSFVPRLVATGDVVVLDVAANALPNLIYAWEVATTATRDNRRAALRRFVAATADAVRWAEENPADAVAISQALLPEMPPDQVNASIRSYLNRGFWSDGKLSPSAFAFTTRTFLDAGVIRAEPRYSDVAGDA